MERRAIEVLKNFEPEDEPYYLCYSGGKDSDCIRILADLAGVKNDIVNNHTTVDAPETVRYIRSIPGIHINMPKYTMWDLIVKKKIPPTRLMRYCCEELKEHGGAGRVKITGVRKSESYGRRENSDLVNIIGKPKTTESILKKLEVDYRVSSKGGIVLSTDNDASRRAVEYCYKTTSTTINPIIDWNVSDVWEFLSGYNCKSNPLYECGFERIGCIGCPMCGAAMMKREFAIYPAYRKLYVHAFDRMLKAREEAGMDNKSWHTGEDVMTWWLGEDPAQMKLEWEDD